MAWFAPCYDLLLRSAERGWLGALRREAVGDLRGRVLEIGAGTGANLAWYPPDASLVLCEPDADMRRVLVRRAADRGAEVLDAPAERLPVPDGAFDTVICTLVLCSVAEVDRAVDEVFRVLRPGGELRFVEHVGAPGWRGGLQRALDPVWARCAGGCRLHRDPLASLRRHAEPAARTLHPPVPPFLQPVVAGRAVRPQGAGRVSSQCG